MSSRASGLSVSAIIFVAAVGHLTLYPKVADLDAFYHLGHAAAYASGSILDTSFPWATQSVIGQRGADLWWGFHVVLTPFTVFDDVAVGIRVAAGLLTMVLGLAVFRVLGRHGVPGAGWGAALFLIAVPNVFFRYLMVRPHVLSLAASLVLLSVLVRGRWWQVALLAALISWLHLSLFWVAPGVVLAYALARFLSRLWEPGRAEAGRPTHAPPGWVPLAPALGAVLLGTLAGWLLRPHPLAAGELVGVQLIHLLAVKVAGQPLTFAAELQPIELVSLARTSWLLLTAWLLAIAGTVVAAVRGRLRAMDAEHRLLLVASLLISGAFVALALLSARRAMVQWAAFGFLALPMVWTWVTTLEQRRVARSFAAILLIVHVAWSLGRHRLNVDQVAFPGDALAEAAAFLERASEPGEVVFHARWDNFGPLFARNRTNVYLSGMDPIFHFAYDPRRYWEYFYMSADINVEWTCDAFPCAAGVATDSYEVIREHFGARWVLVEPRRNPRLSLHLLNDPRFRLALETQREAVFEVMADTAAAPESRAPESQ